jgi:hypothetical protein
MTVERDEAIFIQSKTRPAVDSNSSPKNTLAIKLNGGLSKYGYPWTEERKGRLSSRWIGLLLCHSAQLHMSTPWHVGVPLLVAKNH